MPYHKFATLLRVEFVGDIFEGLDHIVAVHVHHCSYGLPVLPVVDCDRLVQALVLKDETVGVSQKVLAWELAERGNVPWSVQ